MSSCSLRYYIGPASRFAGVKIDRTDKVVKTKAEADAWIKEQRGLANAGKRGWPYNGYTYKRVRHYGE